MKNNWFKRLISLGLTFCMVFALLPILGVSAEQAEEEGYTLFWSDEFDGTDLNKDVWLPEYLPHASTSGDGALADYDVGDGILTLRIDEDRTAFYANEDNVGMKVSGIQTYNKNHFHEKSAPGTSVDLFDGFKTQYGYFEIRTKIPAFEGGGHVAFWLVGTQEDARADGTGSKQTGEIDILETMNHQKNRYYPKVYAWTDEDLEDWSEYQWFNDVDVVNEWHTYGCDWTPDYLAFYMDGVEIFRTEQSPQYEMSMILSMYINDDPESGYWAGMPSDEYPKEWEIDYVRVYKNENGYPNGVTKPTDTVVVPGEEGAEKVDSVFLADAESDFVDVARNATMTFSHPSLGDYPEAVNSIYPVSADGYVSDYSPEYPNVITFTWDSPQYVDTLQLVSSYATAQAPTVVEIQTMKEGGQWEKAGNYTITWKESSANYEVATLDIPNGNGIVGVKLITHYANTFWYSYVINKVYIYNSDLGSNIATSANLTVSDDLAVTISNLKNVNDGYTDSPHWRTATTLEGANDYYEFSWGAPVNVNAVTLWNQWSGQAPTAWKVLVSHGDDQWEEVASIENATWSEGDLESKTLTFAPQTNVTGVRVQIVDASLIWGGYTIYEVEVLGEVATNLALDAQMTASERITANASSLYCVNDSWVAESAWINTTAIEGDSDYFDFTWTAPVSVDAVTLWNQYSGQAPTAWKVFVTRGNDQWEEVASIENATWSEGDLESKTLTFARQEGVTGVRVQIIDASLIWGGYTVYELQIFGKAAENLAKQATVSVSEDVAAVGADYAVINDGWIETSMGRSLASFDGVQDYYQFDWSKPVSVSSVALWNQYSGQAPTAWKIFVTKGDGAWKQVASVKNVEWTESDLECKVISFARQEDITGLRVQVEDANLIWGAYTIYEIELYEEQLAQIEVRAAEVNGKVYATVQDAIDNANGNAVVLLDDCADVVVSTDLVLDLNGWNATGIVVEDGAILYLTDSATDDYQGEYGTAEVTGTVATCAENAGKTYLVVCKDGKYSAHCYDVALTHISLDAAKDALGYKAQLFGDDVVFDNVATFGFNLWINEENMVTRSKEFDGNAIFSLRLKNIMKNNGGEMDVYGNAFVTFKGDDAVSTSNTYTTTMKKAVEAVDALWSSLSAVQKESVVALLSDYMDTIQSWNLVNIFA